MRMPEAGPLGETFYEARLLAIAEALLVKRPSGGKVETVFTLATHRCVDWLFLDVADLRDCFLAGLLLLSGIADLHAARCGANARR